MKIKIVVIDPELSSRAKRILAAVFVPVILLGGVAIAYGSVPVTWQEGETLTAGDLNSDFSALDTRVTSLEAPKLFDGFSAHTAVGTKPAGWNPAAFPSVEFAAGATGSAFNPVTSVFVAPKAGYYRLSMGGITPTATPSADDRIAMGFYLNGQYPFHMHGGQLSVYDSPLPVATEVMFLHQGDTVTPEIYSTVDLTIGDCSANYCLYFQGEFVGE